MNIRQLGTAAVAAVAFAASLAGSAWACGDKLVALGGGVGFQRVVVSRNPGHIILMLEPASGLDAATRGSISLPHCRSPAMKSLLPRTMMNCGTARDGEARPDPGRRGKRQAVRRRRRCQRYRAGDHSGHLLGRGCSAPGVNAAVWLRVS